MSNLRLPIIKSHATVWIATLTKPHQDGDSEEEDALYEGMTWNERRAAECDAIRAKIVSCYPCIVEESHHGDLLEDRARAGYRSEGVHMVAKSGNDGQNFRVVPLDYSVEEYGSVPGQTFQVLTEFPLDFWEYDRMSVVAIAENGEVDGSITTANSYWHAGCAYVKLGNAVREEATHIQIEEGDTTTLKFEFRGKEYRIQYANSMDQIFDEYQGLVYVHGPTVGSVEL